MSLFNTNEPLSDQWWGVISISLTTLLFASIKNAMFVGLFFLEARRHSLIRTASSWIVTLSLGFVLCLGMRLAGYKMESWDKSRAPLQK